MHRMYKETYKDLVHGTDVESAKNIIENGFDIKGGSDSWCGKGIYFYDIKKKAWWAADRKCREIEKITGKKVDKTILFADIIDICDKDIFDMRAYKDLQHFENIVRPMLKDYRFDISGLDENERIIQLRSMLISFYAHEEKKKLIIGHFKQRPQPMYEHAIAFSDSLNMVFGIETIYCVKDKGIIKNVRQGGS